MVNYVAESRLHAARLRRGKQDPYSIYSIQSHLL